VTPQLVRILAWSSVGLTFGQMGLVLLLPQGPIPPLRWIGYATWAVAVVLAWTGMRALVKHGGLPPGDREMDTTRLVESGPYALVRHPQYLAWPTSNLAVTLICQHWLAALVGVAAFLCGLPMFLRADDEGLAKFGDPYRAYMARVPGWDLPVGLWRWARRRGDA
jgi:protein-S-isoprenylcysteine O-methyltransferase Ste14